MPLRDCLEREAERQRGGRMIAMLIVCAIWIAEVVLFLATYPYRGQP